MIDGDTIDVDGARIRLFGIDAPEMEHPYGRNAKWAMVRLCKGRRITVDLLDNDVHDRLVGVCRRDDGMDLSAEMVRTGHAIDWPKYSGGAYSHLEQPGIRKRLWRCDARQKGRMPPTRT